MATSTIVHGSTLILQLQDASNRLSSAMNFLLHITPSPAEARMLANELKHRIQETNQCLEVLLQHKNECRVCGTVDMSGLEQATKKVLQNAGVTEASLRKRVY